MLRRRHRSVSITSLFEQMSRGTLVNKRSPTYFSPFLSAGSFSPRSVLALASAFSVRLGHPQLVFFVLPRPREANKPSNSSGILRDSGCCRRSVSATSPPLLYSAGRLSCAADARTFANYRSLGYACAARQKSGAK